MNALVDPNGPVLVSVPSNPVPQGVHAGYFATTDKVRLRYARWRGQGTPRGTVCLVQGRTEFIEKYYETVADLQRRGFAVATFDWRGQGGSDRLVANRSVGYVDTFEDYWCDLKSFYREILLPDCPPPFFLVGHSMGGLVGLYAGRNDRMMFERILLSAPMVGLPRQPMSTRRMRQVFEALSFVGLGAVPLRRAVDKPPSEAAFAGNPLTADKTRYMRAVAVLAARPELEIGAPTVRWIAAAAGAMSGAAHENFAGSVKTPVLMLAAANDSVVSTPAIEHLGLRMRTGRHLVIASARHELLMETDAIRGQVLAAFDAFIVGR